MCDNEMCDWDFCDCEDEADGDWEDWLLEENWWCKDCGIHTGVAHEYYMVTKELWDEYGVPNGMLCSPCLEKRAGRRLVPADFPDLPINRGSFPLSPFLMERIRG